MAYCKNCGSSLRDNTRFCENCGSQVEQPMPHNHPHYSPQQKSNVNKIIAIAAIAIVLIVILTVVIFVIIPYFVGGELNPNVKEETAFVGTWILDLEKSTEGLDEALELDDDVTMVLFSDGTATSSYGDLSVDGTWKLIDNRFRIITSYGTSVYDYSFSNNYNTLTLTPIDEDYIYVYLRQ